MSHATGITGCCGVALGDGAMLDVLAEGVFREASDARSVAEDA